MSVSVDFSRLRHVERFILKHGVGGRTVNRESWQKYAKSQNWRQRIDQQPRASFLALFIRGAAFFDQKSNSVYQITSAGVSLHDFSLVSDNDSQLGVINVAYMPGRNGDPLSPIRFSHCRLGCFYGDNSHFSLIDFEHCELGYFSVCNSVVDQKLRLDDSRFLSNKQFESLALLLYSADPARFKKLDPKKKHHDTEVNDPTLYAHSHSAVRLSRSPAGSEYKATNKEKDDSEDAFTLDPARMRAANADAECIRIKATRIHGELSLKHIRAQRRSAAGRKTTKPTINLDDVNVGSSIKLQGARVLGLLKMHSLEVAGTFYAPDLKINNIGALAIEGNDVRIGQSMELSRLNCVGSIKLPNLTVTGDLSISNGRISSVVRTGKPHSAIDLTQCNVSHGIHLYNQNIFGNVNLNGATLGGRLLVRDCSIWSMKGASLRADKANVTHEIELVHSRIKGLSLDRIETKSSLEIRYCKVLWQTKDKQGKWGNSLSCSNAKIEGHLSFLSSQIRGRCALHGTKVSGNWKIKRGKNKSPSNFRAQRSGSECLAADGLEVGGQIEIYDTDCFGVTRLHKVIVGSDVKFSGCTFVAPTTQALNLSHSNIDGDLLFEARYEYTGNGPKIRQCFLIGGVNLDFAIIEGDVSFQSTQFVGRGHYKFALKKSNYIDFGPSISAISCRVGGSVYTSKKAFRYYNRILGRTEPFDSGPTNFIGQFKMEGAQIQGAFILLDAHISDQAVVTSDARLFAISLRATSIAGDCLLGTKSANHLRPRLELSVFEKNWIANVRIEGPVNLAQTRIGSNLVISDVVLRDKEAAIFAPKLDCSGTLLIRRSQFRGLISLTQSTIGDDLIVANNRVSSKRAVLNLSRTKIGGDVELGHQPEGYGRWFRRLSADEIDVGGSFSINSLEFTAGNPWFEVSMMRANINESLQLRKWNNLSDARVVGTVDLSESVIESLDDEQGRVYLSQIRSSIPKLRRKKRNFRLVAKGTSIGRFVEADEVAGDKRGPFSHAEGKATRLKWLALQFITDPNQPSKLRKRKLSDRPSDYSSFSPGTYDRLARYYADRGDLASSRTCMVHKRTLLRRNKFVLSPNRFFSWAWRHLFGYGYSPRRAFFTTIVLITITAAVIAPLAKFNGYVVEPAVATSEPQGSEERQVPVLEPSNANSNSTDDAINDSSIVLRPQSEFPSELPSDESSEPDSSEPPKKCTHVSDVAVYLLSDVVPLINIEHGTSCIYSDDDHVGPGIRFLWLFQFWRLLIYIAMSYTVLISSGIFRRAILR